MLLQDSRRKARTTPDGDLVPLEEQDRGLWDRRRITEGISLVRRALSHDGFGSYTIQAAIAAVHAQAPSVTATDWAQIVGLYDLLLRITPSPVVELNRAVAVAMLDGPEDGLLLVDAIMDRGELEGYHLSHAVRADLCRRMGDVAAARGSYKRALELAEQEPERRFLARRLADLVR
jgi:RNA polymerase sigma-70 factor (ECF subfamily)